MPLGLKFVAPQVSPGTWPAFIRYLYVSFKQNLGEQFRASWPSCFLGSFFCHREIVAALVKEIIQLLRKQMDSEIIQ